MGDHIVKETYDSLFHRGEEHVGTVMGMFEGSEIDISIKYPDIVYLANTAVETYLSGYNIKNGVTVKKDHNINQLYKSAFIIDSIFKEIKDECNYINQFGPKVKYNKGIKIDGNIVRNVIKALEKIYNFPVFKDIRNELREKYNDFPTKEDWSLDISKYYLNVYGILREAENDAKGRLLVERYTHKVLKNRKVNGIFNNEKVTRGEEDTRKNKNGKPLREIIQSYYTDSKTNRKVYIIERVTHNRDGTFTNDIWTMDKKLSMDDAIRFVGIWERKQKSLLLKNKSQK